MVTLTAEIPIEAMEWRNHPSIYKWCRQNTLLSRDEHVRWLVSLPEDKTKKMYGIKESTDSYIGVCGFTSIDMLNRKAEFSLYIAPDHQKRGYGKAALLALFKIGFMDFGFNRIWGETFEGNPAYEMFLKLGMRHEGTQLQSYFKEGRMINCHMVAMLRSGWELKYGIGT